MRRSTALVAAVLPAMLMACGEGGDPAAGHDHDHPHEHAETLDTSAFGRPGAPEEADRKITIEARDSMRFEPNELEVESGETITFVVVNRGRIDHEMIIGDIPYQRAYVQAQEHMAAEHGADHHHGDNGVHVDPGETRELTWTFTTPGDVFFACHVAGHHDAGMVGKIAVAG